MEPGKPKKKQIRVADWMTETVLAVETFDSIGIARQLMAKHRVNQLPVLDNDVLVGIVTDRDLRDAYPTSMMIDRGEAIDRFADSVTVEEVMSHDVFTVRPDTPLKKAVGLLRTHRIGSLPVVKNKDLVGIITRSDILDFVLSGLSVRGPAGTDSQKSAGPRTKGKPRD
jgi:acetoin utilization protein AcuB